MSGLAIRAIDRAGGRAFGFGRANNRRVGLPIEPPNGECELPENPFPGINASNPSSWYSGITKFMSGLFGAQACTEEESTNSIINPNANANPNNLIFKKFQIFALLGRMYDLLKQAVEMAKQNKKAQESLYELALAAE